MGILGLIWFIIACFFKFLVFLISLIIAIPLLFILSALVFAVTGGILACVFVFLDEHTNILDKLIDGDDDLSD